jgi:cytochrome c
MLAARQHAADRLLECRPRLAAPRRLTDAPISEHGPAEPSGDRGAELFQHCAACHTLTPNSGNRAGPSLHGIFGRRIATAPGYNFSEALKQLDIVWTADTIGKLFEIGPTRYTPGPRCPNRRSQTAVNARR